MRKGGHWHPSLQQPTNNQRAAWARSALNHFTDEVGDAGDMQDNIGDLICDLRHLCDAEGVDFQQALVNGLSNYRAEIRGEEAQVKANNQYLELLD